MSATALHRVPAAWSRSATSAIACMLAAATTASLSADAESGPIRPQVNQWSATLVGTSGRSTQHHDGTIGKANPPWTRTAGQGARRTWQRRSRPRRAESHPTCPPARRQGHRRPGRSGRQRQGRPHRHGRGPRRPRRERCRQEHSMKLVYGVHHADEARSRRRPRSRDPLPATPGRSASAWCSRTCASCPRSPSSDNIALALPSAPAPQAQRAARAHRGGVEDLRAPRRPPRHRAGPLRSASGRAEILKVLIAGARLVILDELTSVLAPRRSTRSSKASTSAGRRLSVVIITHKLPSCARRRQGDRAPRRQADPRWRRPDRPHRPGARSRPWCCKASRRPANDRPCAPRSAERPCSARHLLKRGERPRSTASTVDVRAGELRGRGRRVGQRPEGDLRGGPGLPGRTGVEVSIDGLQSNDDERPQGSRPRCRRCARGPDRRVVPGLNVPGTSPSTTSTRAGRGLGIDWRAGAPTWPSSMTTGLRVAAPRPDVSTLSGGNIQRVMLCRALGRCATLVVAAYPSRGLDIATTRRTQELLLEQRAGRRRGAAHLRGPRRAARALRPHRRAARRPRRRRRRSVAPPTATRSAG